MACRTVNGESGRFRTGGFTLIELLVVMAIIATLLTIAVPRYFRSLDQARDATLRQDLSVMRDAIDKYMGDTGKFPETMEDLVAARYLRSLPVDPVTKSAETWIFERSEDPESPGIRDVRSGADGVAMNGVAYGAL